MEIKILKKENEVLKVEIDGREYKNISKVEIKNKEIIEINNTA
nr:MAG TPA: hypothetical protein [Caudoviricetes sp.]